MIFLLACSMDKGALELDEIPAGYLDTGYTADSAAEAEDDESKA